MSHKKKGAAADIAAAREAKHDEEKERRPGLKEASDELRNDREVVLTAVSQAGVALKFTELLGSPMTQLFFDATFPSPKTALYSVINCKGKCVF